MARILCGRDYGGPDQLTVIERELAEPGPDQVRIAVRAAAVNPSDLKTLAGAFGSRAEPPVPLGSELAGVVTAVGDEAIGAAGPIAVGDEVVAFRVPGAFASEVVASASAVFPKPAALDWPQASGLLLTATTAWHLLEATRVGAGDRVLVHGASGAVGAALVQLARARGAEVVGTASARNHELVARLGATPLAYGGELVTRVRQLWPGGATVALDTVGTDEALDASAALVADRNRIATIVAFARGAELGIQLLGGGPGADPGTAIRNAARLPLVELAAAGRLEVIVAARFGLDEARAAFELVASGHPGGKVVLQP